MHTYRAGGVVRLLGWLASAAYFVTWAFAVFMLAAVPLGKVLGAPPHGSGAGWTVQLSLGGVAVSAGTPWGFRIEAPVRLPRTQVGLPVWREPGGQVEVTEVKGRASVPLASLSAGEVVLVWAGLAIFLALVLLFLHHLRRLLERVRGGAPFDPANADRLRWLGILLLSAALWKGVSEFWLSLTIARVLEGPGNDLGTGFELAGSAIGAALALMALAEIFRRGAALEDEQALVV